MDFYGDKTQILAEDSAVNATQVVYTVPAGKRFYLISSDLDTDAGAVGIVSAVIQDGTPTIQKYINQIRVGATAQVIHMDHSPLNYPIEIPAGWEIAVISDTALLTGTLSIFGFETNA
jgi:hypothetical protein